MKVKAFIQNSRQIKICTTPISDHNHFLGPSLDRFRIGYTLEQYAPGGCFWTRSRSAWMNKVWKRKEK